MSPTSRESQRDNAPRVPKIRHGGALGKEESEEEECEKEAADKEDEKSGADIILYPFMNRSAAGRSASRPGLFPSRRVPLQLGHSAGTGSRHEQRMQLKSGPLCLPLEIFSALITEAQRGQKIEPPQSEQ